MSDVLFFFRLQMQSNKLNMFWRKSYWTLTFRMILFYGYFIIAPAVHVLSILDHLIVCEYILFTGFIYRY